MCTVQKYAEPHSAQSRIAQTAILTPSAVDSESSVVEETVSYSVRLTVPAGSHAHTLYHALLTHRKMLQEQAVEQLLARDLDDYLNTADELAEIDCSITDLFEQINWSFNKGMAKEGETPDQRHVRQRQALELLISNNNPSA